MKVTALLLLAAVVATSNVHAAGSVQINGYTFYCQNSCVVYALCISRQEGCPSEIAVVGG